MWITSEQLYEPSRRSCGHCKMPSTNCNVMLGPSSCCGRFAVVSQSNFIAFLVKPLFILTAQLLPDVGEEPMVLLAENSE